MVISHSDSSITVWNNLSCLFYLTFETRRWKKQLIGECKNPSCTTAQLPIPTCRWTHPRYRILFFFIVSYTKIMHASESMFHSALCMLSVGVYQLTAQRERYVSLSSRNIIQVLAKFPCWDIQISHCVKKRKVARALLIFPALTMQIKICLAATLRGEKSRFFLFFFTVSWIKVHTVLCKCLESPLVSLYFAGKMVQRFIETCKCTW